ncbi:MAG: peroxiredoxin [Calditrichaeota bacterium]|nr:peroxiredoxin [Calditrichota bacterium]
MSVLVGKKAPDFSADAVVNGGDFEEGYSLSQFHGKKYVVLFFYPLDFTFVCPTELHAFQEKLDEFKKRNTEVIGVSVDSKFSHWAWLNTDKDKGGIKGVNYPIVSDINKTIAADYDVLVDGGGVAYRGLFLIDKDGVVRHQTVNDLPLGRNVNEAIRLLDALQYTEEHGEVCPANWEKGKDAMKADAKGVASYLASH